MLISASISSGKPLIPECLSIVQVYQNILTSNSIVQLPWERAKNKKDSLKYSIKSKIEKFSPLPFLPNSKTVNKEDFIIPPTQEQKN